MSALLLALCSAIAGAAAGAWLQRRKAELRFRVLEAQVGLLTAEREAALAQAEARIREEQEAFVRALVQELRAPQRVVQSFTEQIVKDEAPWLAEPVQDRLRRILAAGRRLGQGLDDLQRLQELSRRPQEPVDLDLGELVARLGRDLRLARPDRSVRLRVQPSLAARGDAELVGMALDQLLAQAWRATAGRPEARVDVGAAPREGRRAFYVRDNGTGAEATEVPAGLNLAIARRLVALLGGELWSEPVPEEGTTVWFTLGEEPAAAPQDGAPQG